MTDLNAELIERAAKAGFAWSAASAAQQYDLGEPVTWDRHLSDEDRAHEIGRTHTALESVADDIRAEAWEQGHSAADLEWRHVYYGDHTVEPGDPFGMCTECGQGNPYARKDRP